MLKDLHKEFFESRKVYEEKLFASFFLPPPPDAFFDTFTTRYDDIREVQQLQIFNTAYKAQDVWGVKTKIDVKQFKTERFNMARTAVLAKGLDNAKQLFDIYGKIQDHSRSPSMVKIRGALIVGSFFDESKGFTYPTEFEVDLLTRVIVAYDLGFGVELEGVKNPTPFLTYEKLNKKDFKVFLATRSRFLKGAL